MQNFKFLNHLVHSGAKEITLNSDIVLGDDEDEYGYEYEDPIGISLNVDDIIIDGNGYTIDAREKSRIFSFSAKNIIIKNVTIKNSGALENVGGVVKIINTTFENNIGSGGAIVNRDGEITIINCKFIGNEAKRRGGAIFNRGEMNIVDSIFENNRAYHSGGAIYTEGKLDVKDSTFLNNYADGPGGAIYSNKSNVLNLENCSFKDNKPNDVNE